MAKCRGVLRGRPVFNNGTLAADDDDIIICNEDMVYLVIIMTVSTCLTDFPSFRVLREPLVHGKCVNASVVVYIMNSISSSSSSSAGNNARTLGSIMTFR
ncbi:unnamed protein product, partial [Iphiclides podalirius]